MINILSAPELDLRSVFIRNEESDDVSAKVAAIIADIYAHGDDALIQYSREFDGVELTSLEVTSDEIGAAFCAVEPRFIEVLEKAAANIEAFHLRQVREGFTIAGEDGIVLGQKVTPLSRVGVYIPGGTASYPSTVLMNAIPAKIAGVGEIVMTSPPSHHGGLDPHILAAAKIAGVGRVFRIGGAQAIAALAFGTRSVPPVDKIVGPGNAFVAEAKRQVYGQVGIDMIAGPSEILVIADETADAAYVAADMLSQAEHDRNAAAVLLTDSDAFARAVAEEIEIQLQTLPRYDIARASIDSNGKIIVAGSIREAIGISNVLAPEHLEICARDPFQYLDDIKNAGSIFLGNSCPEALGDYFAGPNHTLPTMGTARFSSPLSVDDFVKRSSFTYYTRPALRKVADDIAYFAEKEGLHGHARSVLARFRDGEVTG